MRLKHLSRAKANCFTNLATRIIVIVEAQMKNLSLNLSLDFFSIMGIVILIYNIKFKYQKKEYTSEKNVYSGEYFIRASQTFWIVW